MESVEIVDYNEQYHEGFKQLSYEWLEKYVTVEPEDVRILMLLKKLFLIMVAIFILRNIKVKLLVPFR
ncbi:hypothetical protein [Candidatus Enterococcus willemsii]|uniref:hypothetical protein n=1 Tax=Candidatus Enterococcus willemsii TaxID=1857215 RepID=UPI001F1A2999|nr:hypothetical protein [Enterococcus sp. CU12B]